MGFSSPAVRCRRRAANETRLASKRANAVAPGSSIRPFLQRSLLCNFLRVESSPLSLPDGRVFVFYHFLLHDELVIALGILLHWGVFGLFLALHLQSL